MKVPDTLEGLLDLMRAKGCASFDFEAQGVGGTPLKVSGRFDAPLQGLAAWLPDRSTPLGTGIHASMDREFKQPVSDIELALNPPVLDEAEEAADPSEALAPEAPRVSAPAGAPDPDASA